MSHDDKKIKICRQETIDRIANGRFVSGIIIDGRHEALGYDPVHRCYDPDGHSILARAVPLFDFDEQQIARLTFRQGVSPRVLADMARKYARILDGLAGERLVRLGLGPEDRNFGTNTRGAYVYVLQAASESEVERGFAAQYAVKRKVYSQFLADDVEGE